LQADDHCLLIDSYKQTRAESPDAYEENGQQIIVAGNRADKSR